MRCAGFSLQGLLSLWSTGSRASVFAACGLSSCGSRAPEHRLCTSGTQAWLLRSMWDLPGSGIKPRSPALAGRFFATEPPGKLCLYGNHLFWTFHKNRHVITCPFVSVFISMRFSRSVCVGECCFLGLMSRAPQTMMASSNRNLLSHSSGARRPRSRCGQGLALMAVVENLSRAFLLASSAAGEAVAWACSGIALCGSVSVSRTLLTRSSVVSNWISP